MQIHPYGLFPKSMVFLLLIALLTSAADNKEAIIPAGYKKNSTTEVQVQQQQMQVQYVKHAFDAFSSSKRRVPNESDPLHNR